MKKKEKVFNKILYLFIVVVGFSFAFALLINKQQQNNLADVNNSKYNEKTIYGKQVVARDMDSIYPKYYIALFMDNSYVIQSIDFYDTNSQYELDFSREKYSIIDYDKSQKMIRYEIKRGKASYEELRDNFAAIIGVDNIEYL